MFSHAMFLRTNNRHGSNSESLSEEEEFEDYVEDEGEDDAQDQQFALPAYFLGAHICRHRDRSGASSGATEPESSAPESDADAVAAGESAVGTASNMPPPPEPTSTLSALPWRQSKEKEQIIIELKDPSSDIHLLLGRYTDKDFKSVSFKHILIVYAGNRFKMSNFRENMKRLLVHKLNQTGDFKEKTTEPWYTSVNKVSKAYSLLFMMYMDSTMSQAVRSLSDEELWKSHPQFQLHELKKFETYNKNMKILTSKRTALISKEEDSYNADLLILSTRGEISRDVPLWNTHVASDMLKEHIEEEMSGAITKTKPQMLWKSMKEYQDFPLSIFRKHMYQERTKQLAAPFWQHKRNKIARTRFEETEAMLKEWSQAQLNMRVDAVAAKMEHINLDNNDV